MVIIRKDINIITKALTLLMTMIIGYLFIVSLFSTVYVSEFENIYYVKDSATINIAVIIAIVVLMRLFYTKLCKLIEGKELLMVIINSVVLFVILVYFVMSTRLYPLYDQAKILSVVKQLAAYDYAAFLPGGYEDRCNVQWGITLYFYAISKLFGNVSITAIQLLNVVYIIVSNFLVYKITSFAFSKKMGAIIHLAMCLYMPEWLYSSFVYGTLPSFMFALLSIYFIALLRKQIKVSETSADSYSIMGKDFIITKKARRFLLGLVYIVLASACMGVAIIMKTNSLIILIAMILVLLYYLLRDAKPVYAFAAGALLIVYILSMNILTAKIMDMTRLEPQGMPRTGFIAMGLMENSEKGPGWYNGYNDEVYVNNNFNMQSADEEARAEIGRAIDGFKRNPANLISFLSRKTVSQWNEPTFESLYILYRRDSISNAPKWFKELSVPTSVLNKSIRELFNILHAVILFGALCYFVLDYKRITLDHLVFAVVILGGFFFHTMWEAKSQYILIYFILLIAYAVPGYKSLVNIIPLKKKRDNVPDSEGETKGTVDIKSKINIVVWLKERLLFTYVLVVTLICLFTAIVPAGSAPGKILKPSWKTEEYLSVTDSKYNEITPAGKLDSEYIEGLKLKKETRLLGRYYIQNAEDQELYLIPNLDAEAKLEVDSLASVKFSRISVPSVMDSAIVFEISPGKNIIRFQSNQKVLDVENGIIEKGAKLHTWDFNGDMGQCFSLKNNADGTYSIVCGEFALKMVSDGSVELTDLDDLDVLRVKLIRMD